MRGVAALVVLALCLAPIAAGQTGKAQSVTVVSPIANPVNVKPVGTVPVSGNVGITEPVRVTGPLGGPVPVTGRVGISGPVTGTVGISGSPSVNVANATAASPLSVRTLTREPINLAGYGVTGEQCTIELFDVPPGKRLVVEQVTSEVYVSTAPPLVFAPVKLYNGASLVNQITGQTHVVSYSLEPKRLAGSYADTLLVSQQVRIYVESGKRLKISWGDRAYAFTECSAYVSGHLEPAEVAPLP